MKGSQHPSNETSRNPSANDSIGKVLTRAGLSRREFVKTGLAGAVTGLLAPSAIRTAAATAELATQPVAPLLGFEAIAPSLAPLADRVSVPAGYRVEVMLAWGDPILPGAAAWLPDATQSAAEQARQFGMHNDGMVYFPLDPAGSDPANEGAEAGAIGLLCVNHEYTDEQLLHGAEGLTGGAGVTLAKVRKSQAAQGVSVVGIHQQSGGDAPPKPRWAVDPSSSYARRIDANTLMRLSGPAAGHALLRSRRFSIEGGASKSDGHHDGHHCNGTLNNCGSGATPWGTYLSCEENWNANFGYDPLDRIDTGTPAYDALIADNHRRYGVSAEGAGYQWHRSDPRFNARTNPFETHLFGWVVEIDPFDPAAMPVKRTALGRFKHENARLAISADAAGNSHRFAYYLGDDERNEYIYKFVAARPFDPGDRTANRDLLDTGTLHVARYTDAPGATPNSCRGHWIALEPATETVIPNGRGAYYTLRELPRFAAQSDAEVQALILIQTRQAADAVGATMMDRPEWMALRSYANGAGYDDRGHGRGYDAEHPLEIYCTLTNNDRRGGGGADASTTANAADGTTPAGSARPPLDAANPRPDNRYGHILRWREDANQVTATGFEWDIFTLCGDSRSEQGLGANYQPAVDGTAAKAATPYHGNIRATPPGSADIGAPDGLWFDGAGRLWIQTDQPGDALGDYANIGANCLACADPHTKEIRRFLTAPPRCEVTGITGTADGRSLFVGIQHPGDGATADEPTRYSRWPQAQFAMNSAGRALVEGAGVGDDIRPRSCVLVITRVDGGVVGA